MASDKRPILSGKRLRNRRKRAALRAVNRANASPIPECDSDEDGKRKQQQQHQHLGCDDSTASDKTASQSEDEIDPSLVFVCRPTMPDFCSVFQPRGEDSTDNLSRTTQSRAADCKIFTVHIPTFQETCEGYVTYTLELTTCDAPRHTFQVERRFSEFVACSVEVNQQLASGFAARCCTILADEERTLEDAEKFQWELPAKTWFRMTQTNALEERRAELERSLETLLLQQNRQMCNLPVIRDFLMLDIFGVQVAEQKNREAAAHFE